MTGSKRCGDHSELCLTQILRSGFNIATLSDGRLSQKASRRAMEA